MDDEGFAPVWRHFSMLGSSAVAYLGLPLLVACGFFGATMFASELPLDEIPSHLDGEPISDCAKADLDHRLAGGESLKRQALYDAHRACVE